MRLVSALLLVVASLGGAALAAPPELSVEAAATYLELTAAAGMLLVAVVLLGLSGLWLAVRWINATFIEPPRVAESEDGFSDAPAGYYYMQTGTDQVGLVREGDEAEVERFAKESGYEGVWDQHVMETGRYMDDDAYVSWLSRTFR